MPSSGSAVWAELLSENCVQQAAVGTKTVKRISRMLVEIEAEPLYSSFRAPLQSITTVDGFS